MGYDPALGVFLERDPLPQQTGRYPDGTNLYQYVRSSPGNFTDPTGLAVTTEAQARQILTKEIADWRAKSWNLAPDLLQYFLDKKGPTPYVLSQSDTDEVIKKSTQLVQRAIYQGIWNDTAITCKNLGKASIAFKDHVGWSNPYIPFTAGEQVQDSNEALFYAYGGADLDLTGTVKNLTIVQSPVRFYFRFDVQAKVTISDTYTFAPTGPFDIRLRAEAYEAAHFLQTTPALGYTQFSHTVTFDKLYTGLRSDRIMGFLFHTQRPA